MSSFVNSHHPFHLTCPTSFSLANGDLQVWDLHSRRPAAVVRKAHSNLGLFGLMPVGHDSSLLLSHGRDAVLRLWRLAPGTGAGQPVQLLPLLTEPDFGSLSFCRLGSVALSSNPRTLAVATAGASPNCVQLGLLHFEAEEDVRLVKIGTLTRPTLPEQHGVVTEAGGMIMSAAFAAPAGASEGGGMTTLRLFVGYEDGSVGVWETPVADHGGSSGSSRT